MSLEIEPGLVQAIGFNGIEVILSEEIHEVCIVVSIYTDGGCL